MRNLVLVADDPQHFTPTEVQLGAEANGNTVIVSGLRAGQQVVASGQFLIDSEANLSGVLSRLSGNAVTNDQANDQANDHTNDGANATSESSNKSGSAP